MDSKLLLMVIAAVLAVAAAAPHAHEQWMSYTCQNPQSLQRSTNIFGTWLDLDLCSQPGSILGFCIAIFPPMPYCNWPKISDCHYPFINRHSQQYYVGICNEPYGKCVASGNVAVCNGWQATNKVAIEKALEFAKKSDDSDEGCFCVDDRKGHKICTPAKCDEGGVKKQEDDADCFCIKDDKGHKVCDPEGCDAGSVKKQEDDDCFCIEDGQGNKVCDPEGCDAGSVKKQADDDDCFCIKDGQGNKVCDPEGCY